LKMRGSQPHSRQSVPCSDRATALLRRRTIEAMKMLISRRTSSKAASAASAIPNDEAGTIGDAVILISDKMTSRNSFRWTGSRSFRALKYRFGPCASKIGIGAYNAEVEMCALFATRNSLKLQEVRKVFLPIRNIHARTLKLCSRGANRPPLKFTNLQIARRRQIPIEPAARPTYPFPRFPPLEAFGRRPPELAAPSVVAGIRNPCMGPIGVK